MTWRRQQRQWRPAKAKRLTADNGGESESWPAATAPLLLTGEVSEELL